MSTEAELLTRLNEHVTAVEALYAKSDESGGKLTADDRSKLNEHDKAIDELETQVKDARARGANDERHERLNGKPVRPLVFPGNNGSGSGKSDDRGARGVERKSMGELFVESPEWTDYFKAIAPGGNMPSRARVQSPPFDAKGLMAAVIGAVSKGLLTSVGLEPLIVPDRLGLQAEPWPPIEIFSVITNGTTTTDTIEFARETERENLAAPVPEATAITGTSGTKPMSNFSIEPDSTSVKTIAHWIPATKRALADVAQLRTMIDSFLREGLRQQLAYQVIEGDGTGENFRGILATPGLQGPVDGGMLVATRRARTLIQSVGFATPNAYVMNPLDWEALDLLTAGTTGQFYFGGPLQMGTPRLWGLPVVQDAQMAEGTALCGDFRTCILWNREQATISATDSHADFFIRNLVAILGELRAAFAVLRPSAICKITMSSEEPGVEGLAARPAPAAPAAPRRPTTTP